MAPAGGGGNIYGSSKPVLLSSRCRSTSNGRTCLVSGMMTSSRKYIRGNSMTNFKRDEMSYEEKYKEALKRADSLTEKYGGREFAEYVFPELAESEDERIRKQLIDAIKIGRSNSGISFTEEAASRYIAWLEKHGEEEIKKIRNEEYTNGFNNAAGFGK